MKNSTLAYWMACWKFLQEGGVFSGSGNPIRRGASTPGNLGRGSGGKKNAIC